MGPYYKNVPNIAVKVEGYRPFASDRNIIQIQP